MCLCFFFFFFFFFLVFFKTKNIYSDTISNMRPGKWQKNFDLVNFQKQDCFFFGQFYFHNQTFSLNATFAEILAYINFFLMFSFSLFRNYHALLMLLTCWEQTSWIILFMLMSPNMFRTNILNQFFCEITTNPLNVWKTNSRSKCWTCFHWLGPGAMSIFPEKGLWS